MKSILLRIALFGFLLAGMSAFSSVGQLKAQNTVNQDIYSLPTGTFASSGVAKIRLESKIVELKTQLTGLTQGTSQYQAVWGEYSYYNTILNSVNAGKTVPQSIVDGLQAVSTDEFGLSRYTLLQYRTDAVNLLKA
jgi:hypothetical protein